jgi:hypothetical protein
MTKAPDKVAMENVNSPGRAERVDANRKTVRYSSRRRGRTHAGRSISCTTSSPVGGDFVFSTSSMT